MMTPDGPIEEVPLSSVIARANDENGDIAKITVEGSNLKITLKGKDRYTPDLEKRSVRNFIRARPNRSVCGI